MILVLMRHLIIAREVEFTTNEGRIVRQQFRFWRKLRVSSMFLWFSNRKIDF